ncbi:MAG: deoxyribodipyrimidine photo-lyase, partial [Desulfovermiculus sp.]
MDPRRIQTLHPGLPGAGPVVYWMSRDQRINDNWALIYAQKLALQAMKGLVIVFCLQPTFLHAAWRHYHFMLRGLQEICHSSLELGIPFVLRCGHPPDVITDFVHKWEAESLICDFDPLRIKVQWRKKIAARLNVPVYMVDAHNIVPCWEASSKQEYSARTIRPKIQRKLFDFLHPFPNVQSHPHQISGLDTREPEWNGFENRLEVDSCIPPVSWLAPGTAAAGQVLDEFLAFKLHTYAQKNNDPNASVLSNLSAYLHFGQIAPQQVALQVQEQEDMPAPARESFLEQMIIMGCCGFLPGHQNFLTPNVVWPAWHLCMTGFDI